jgi:hypothetical protein
MIAPAAVFQIVLNAMELAKNDEKGEFYLSDAAYRTGVDNLTLYGYTGNPGISGALQNLGVIEHAPKKGHFRFVTGYTFPGALI